LTALFFAAAGRFVFFRNAGVKPPASQSAIKLAHSTWNADGAAGYDPNDY
jgi:hypothetical protein